MPESTLSEWLFGSTCDHVIVIPCLMTAVIDCSLTLTLRRNDWPLLCTMHFCFQAMVGILQGKARGGEEETILMHDLKPFRILISLLDKPELGISPVKIYKNNINNMFSGLVLITSVWMPLSRASNPGGCFDWGVSDSIHTVPDRAWPSEPKSIQQRPHTPQQVSQVP